MIPGKLEQNIGNHEMNYLRDKRWIGAIHTSHNGRIATGNYLLLPFVLTEIPSPYQRDRGC